MKIKVGEYHPTFMAHKCVTDEGERVWIDIMVNGDLPRGINPDHLVGMEFDVDYIYPFLSIAYGVK